MRRDEHGATLAISLVILLALSLIGISSLQIMQMDKRMSGNIAEMNRSLQATETALREAEQTIEGLTDVNGFDNASGLYSLGNAPDIYVAGTWTGNQSIAATANLDADVQPRYFIELIGEYQDTDTAINVQNYGEQTGTASSTAFRVVAKGYGAAGTAPIILQAYYWKSV